MNHVSIWKFVAGTVLAVFCAYGTAYMFFPDCFLKAWERGGEMLPDSERRWFRIAGTIFAAVAISILRKIFRS